MSGEVFLIIYIIASTGLIVWAVIAAERWWKKNFPNE